MRKEEAEFLITCKGADMTPEEVREVAKWWRRTLRSQISRDETLAAVVSSLRAQGKTDTNESARRVTAALRNHRSQVIGSATWLARVPQYAEFRDDFEGIAARAEALPI